MVLTDFDNEFDCFKIFQSYKYHVICKIYLLKIQYFFDRAGRCSVTSKVIIEVNNNLLTLIKMYRYCNQSLKHTSPTKGLKPSIIWFSVG